jgi:hypothetical protein
MKQFKYSILSRVPGNDPPPPPPPPDPDPKPDEGN